MSGECQLPLQQQQRPYGLSFHMQSAAMASPWLAACRRDGSTTVGPPPPPPPGTAEYWLRHRDHQQTDASAPAAAASCYFSRHQGKSPHHQRRFQRLAWLASRRQVTVGAGSVTFVKKCREFPSWFQWTLGTQKPWTRHLGPSANCQSFLRRL